MDGEIKQKQQNDCSRYGGGGHSQIKAAVKVNSERLLFNWQLGRDLVMRKAEERWETGIVEQVSLDLQAEFPQAEGFSTSNLWYMKRWYLFYFLHTLKGMHQNIHFDTFTFAELNITIKYKCIFEKKSCSELTLTLVLNDYRLNQTATLLIGEPSQLEL